LARFLIDRAAKNMELANYLYWYLKVELQNPIYADKYRLVFSAFRLKLSSTLLLKETYSILDISKHELYSTPAHSTTMWEVLYAQDHYISSIMNCQMIVSQEVRGKKDVKEVALREMLSSKGLKRIGMKHIQAVPLPVAPEVFVTGCCPSSARMFKSVLYPVLIEFFKFSEKDKTYKVIVKTGDDLRQDQLISMMVRLMDGLLKRATLDLCLISYTIIATSPTSGLVEYVEHSMPLSQILASYQNSILLYFQTVSYHPSSKYNIQPKVLQAYIRSCAGYCVITYLLGVGDRHLDNVMLLPSGHFFHIDFGFIFGRDPKPLPPPFRLTREMVEGMGGSSSPEYQQFCSLCCQAFNVLRKSANLVLNLLHLMTDAGIVDLSNNPAIGDADAVIAKVEERFRLELSDEQAESYFLGLISDTLAAFTTRVMDVFHQIAVSRR